MDIVMEGTAVEAGRDQWDFSQQESSELGA